MARSSVRWWVSGLALVLLGALASSPASAQEDPPPGEPPAADEVPDEEPFAVQPSGPEGPGGRDWFTYDLLPGEVFGDVVGISNLGDRPIHFLIYPTDAVPVSDVGGLAPLREDEVPVDVGSWIELKAGKYTVQPQTRVDIPFKITVPEDAEPGDHVGAILAVDRDRGTLPAGEEDQSLNIRKRIGARVYVRVEGRERPALEVTEIDVDDGQPIIPFTSGGGSATISWEIENIGNLTLEPEATVRITGLFNRTIKTIEAEQLPQLLPGGNYVGMTQIDGGLPPEPLTVHLDITTPSGVQVSRSQRFWSVPWVLILVLLGLLIAYLIRRRLHGRGEQATDTGPSEPPPTKAKELVDA